MTKPISIGGIPVNVGTPEECEQASFVVCGPESFFPDDVHTTCAFCHTPIVHRPSVPMAPPKICLRCLQRVVSTKES